MNASLPAALNKNTLSPLMGVTGEFENAEVTLVADCLDFRIGRCS